MWRRTGIAVLAAVVALGLVGGAVVVAQDAGANAGGAAEGHPFRRFWTGQIGRLMVLRSELDLTDAQRQQLKAIVQGHRPEIEQVIREVAAEHRALRNAVMVEKPDDKAVRAAAADLSKGIGDAAVLIAKVKAQAWPVLTPEQRKDIENFRADTDKALDGFLARLGQAPGAEGGAANP